MAALDRRRAENVDGDVFVDATCIDCGTCRWMAPETFDHARGASRVHAQPSDDRAVTRALAALVACPTGSIGTVTRHPLGEVVASFPRPIDDRVLHCGFHARASFGAASWLVERPDGNVLVDSPRYLPALADRIAARGPVRWMFLTHRDDVADHARWAERLGCERVIHADDVDARTADVERRLTGRDPVTLAPGLVVWPTPGHTRGSACLLVEDRWLFTGDTLAGDARGRLRAFWGACWHDPDVLRASLRRLATLRFAWVLPGHGAPVHGDPDDLAAQTAAVADG